ncbi:hypothetical protein BMS3Abin07_01118 [bacterium BMS3Abin07]|nr:hypothetical protein BMS3Abin07_01118 [bacterium BMS3Abin07]GBE31607.1 hypothetical protein BMS3Bbin05_00510 [bacterium BMS3Bbin05]HDO21719.1 ABC transporter substrate-binding protein [Nitrospirota bacterium]HDZ87074.1 ABC transporter substrate-binding protein [Nitrospirota bacterium]
MRLRVGHLSTLYHTSILMMAREELLDGFGAEVEWSLFGTGPAIVEAFRKKEIDMAYIGLPPAVIGIDKGTKIRCIAGGHVEGTVIAAGAGSPAYPETDKFGEILSCHKIIGVPGKGSIHDLILMDAVHANNVPVEVRNFAWADRLLEAFVHGEVDAVAGTPSLAQAVINYAGGKIVYPSNLLWPDNPSYGILVREDLLSSERAVIKDFIVRHERASEMLRNSRESVAADIAELMGVVDEEFVLDTLNTSPRYCASLTEGYISCTMRLTKRLRELGYIESEIPKEKIFDLSIIREVHPGPDHYR